MHGRALCVRFLTFRIIIRGEFRIQPDYATGMIKNWNNRKLHTAIVAGLIFIGAGRCSVHIDTDPFWQEAQAEVAVALLTLQSCSRASNVALEQAERETAAALCLVGAYAVDRHDDDHHH